MDSKHACFVSAIWVLTRALTLQPCDDNFRLVSGRLNNIKCTEVENNASVTWRFGGTGETGHLAGECKWPPLSDEGVCEKLLLQSFIVASRTSHDSSTLTINVTSKLQRGFISCATLENGQIATCNFTVVSSPPKPNFTIVNSQGEKTVKEFDEVLFFCEFSGKSIPELRLENSIKTLTNGSSPVSFSMRNVSCQDSGTYFCTGRNTVVSVDVKSEALLEVHCRPRLLDTSAQRLRVKFTGHPAKYTFDVIAFPPPQLQNLTVFDLETARFIDPSSESDMNVTCSSTTTRPHLSACTLHINNVSLPYKDVAIYRAVLGNQLGQVAVSVTIDQGADDCESKTADKAFLVGIGVGVLTAGGLAVAVGAAVFVIIRLCLHPSDRRFCCCGRCRAGSELSGLQGASLNKGRGGKGAGGEHSRQAIQHCQQGQNELEDIYEVTDDFHRYTENLAINCPEYETEYIQI